MEVFCSRFRVYYEDTDLGGVVYHANYLKFCERTRTDFTRLALDFSQKELLENKGQAFVVSRLNCLFRRPAHFEEELSVSCIPVHMSKAKCEMYQEIKNEAGEVLFALICSLSLIDVKSGRPVRLDPSFTEKVTPFIREDTEKLLSLQ